MALVKGTNCGFVAGTPAGDPFSGFTLQVDALASAIKDTAPVGAARVTEIGWWCDDFSEEANFEVGIYTNDAVNDKPGNLLPGAGLINAKGTRPGWKKVTGLNIQITAGTIYWIAVQLDDTASRTDTDRAAKTGERHSRVLATELSTPWPAGSAEHPNEILGFYAVWAVAVDTNTQINIGDAWKVINTIQINIGGVWKDVVGIWQNIGDVWKSVFG